MKGSITVKYINRSKLCSIILVLILIFSFAAGYAQNVHSDLSRSLVRLHIIANSDSDCDQQLKLAVRDRILERFGELFSECSDADAALAAANANLDLIRRTAAAEVSRRGFGYTVTAETGKFPFPTKVYGSVRLPSGSYNAVRIKIGKADGHNWWCVMYPPLCFTDGVAEISDSSRKKLQSSLSTSDYKLITESDGSLPVEIRFKIAELFHR